MLKVDQDRVEQLERYTQVILRYIKDRVSKKDKDAAIHLTIKLERKGFSVVGSLTIESSIKNNTGVDIYDLQERILIHRALINRFSQDMEPREQVVAKAIADKKNIILDSAKHLRKDKDITEVTIKFKV